MSCDVGYLTDLFLDQRHDVSQGCHREQHGGDDILRTSTSSRLRQRSGTRSGLTSPLLQHDQWSSPRRLQSTCEQSSRTRSTSITDRVHRGSANRLPPLRPGTPTLSPKYAGALSFLKDKLSAGDLKAGGKVQECRPIQDPASASTSPASSPCGTPTQLLKSIGRPRNAGDESTEKFASRAVGCSRSQSCSSISAIQPASPLVRIGLPSRRSEPHLESSCGNAADERPGFLYPPGAEGTSATSGLLARRRADRPGLPCLTLERQPAVGKRLTTETVAAVQKTLCVRPLEQGQKIYDLYYWDEVIQEDGCGGKVVVCSPKDVARQTPRSPFACKDADFKIVKGTHVMKIKSKERLHRHNCEEQFRNAHQKMLNMHLHKGILPLHEILEDSKNYYVVMERASGGALLRSLLEEFPDGVMPEKAVKRLLKDILSAVGHLHNEGLLHRDIKIENLVAEVDDAPTSPGGKVRTVKIIDFDTVDPDWVPNSPGQKQADWAGTLRNSAPETFKGYFSQKSDLYSVGTILYLLMSGRMPYDDSLFDNYEDFDNLQELSNILERTEINWDARGWIQHPVCQDFCRWLLAYEPDKRPLSATEALQHDWFSQRSAKPS